MTKWPKHRPELSPEQQAIMLAWYEYWLPLLDQRFGAGPNHSFPLRSADSSIRTLEIGVGEGTHARMEGSENYYGLDLVPSLIQHRVRMVAANAEQGIPFRSASFDRVPTDPRPGAPGKSAGGPGRDYAGDETDTFHSSDSLRRGLGYTLGRNVSVRPILRKEIRQELRLDDCLRPHQHRPRRAGRVAHPLQGRPNGLLPA